MNAVLSTPRPFLFKEISDVRTGALASQGGRMRETAKMVDVSRGCDIVPAGHDSSSCHFLKTGFACSYKLLNDGRRQITSIHIAGDLIDLTRPASLSGYAVAALSACQVLAVERQTLLATCDRNLQLAEQLWDRELIGVATQREWLVSLGRRTALARMSHIFLELLTRLQQAGLSDGHSCRLPIPQTEFADVLGLSGVHVNRMVQHLRQTRVISWDGEVLMILNKERLMELADFDACYLRIDPQGACRTSLDLFTSGAQTLTGHEALAIKNASGAGSSEYGRGQGARQPEPIRTDAAHRATRSMRSAASQSLSSGGRRSQPG